MSPDRSRQVEELYRAALERSGESRAALLSALDPALREEVEARLSNVSPPGRSRVAAGTAVSIYRIEERLGEGGMGVVYRALDTRLNRPVAVKFLAEDLADAAARRRFQREAQLASSLNHPHIVTVFDVGEFEERHYVVTEFIDGGTLRRWIEDRKPWRQTVELLTGVADGLAAAHSLNILHRDIKPENILLTKSGYAKLGDFGLAKLAEPPGDPSAATRSLAHNSTRKGVALGTPAYMSPEQASCQELDTRSDVFSFGVVLHEALSGQRPFTGKSDVDVLHQVIHSDPQPLSDALPLALRMVVEKALEKDPNERYQSMRDLVVDLRHAVRRASSDAVAVSRTPAPGGSEIAPSTLPVNTRKAIARWLWPSVAGAALLAVGVTAGLYFRPAAPVGDSIRLQIPLPPNTTFTVSGNFAISPDGKNLVFGAVGADNQARLWLRALDSVETKPLEGTTHDPRNSTVFWSPDSRLVAYWASGRLYKLDITGGRPQQIGVLPQAPVGGFWGPDNVILVGTFAGILRIDAQTGVTSPTTTLNADRQESAHAAPVLLPDGKHFLYTRGSQAAEYRGLFVGSLDVEPENQSLQALLPSSMASAGNTAYADSQLWYYRAGSVVAQPFDLARLALAGEPARVVDQVDSNTLGFDLAYFSVSSTGVLVYRFGGPTVNRQPTWYDRQGRILGTSGEPGYYSTFKLSPDSKRLVYGGRVGPFSNSDILVLDLERGTTTRITADPAPDLQPLWSPDGTQVSYGRIREGSLTLFRRAADGSGPEERITDNLQGGNFTDWTPDGRYILTFGASPKTLNDIWALPLDGSPRFPVIQTNSSDVAAYVSPNGRWIAYMSNESGRNEIYVQPFTPSSDGPVAGRKWIVSTGGSFGMPRWRNDGSELLYLASDGNVMAVPVTTTSPDFSSGAPQRLFELPRNFLALSIFPGQFIDVTRDNQRFLVQLPVIKTPLDEFTVVLNWRAGLEN